jgi:hypothetical protein
MDDEAPVVTAPQLRREVEPPQRQATGVAVLLLTSASLFLAVAGSALAVRATVRAQPAPPTEVVVYPAYDQLLPPTAPAPADCGIVARTGPHGEHLVDFHLCPDDGATP